MTLNETIGVLACHSGALQLQLERLAVYPSAAQRDVFFHLFGIDLKAGNHPLKTRKGEVRQSAAVGKDRALHGRMRDVALVPENNVLKRGRDLGADESRKSREILAEYGIALVRHRR